MQWHPYLGLNVCHPFVASQQASRNVQPFPRSWEPLEDDATIVLLRRACKDGEVAYLCRECRQAHALLSLPLLRRHQILRKDESLIFRCTNQHIDPTRTRKSNRCRQKQSNMLEEIQNISHLLSIHQYINDLPCFQLHQVGISRYLP